MIDYTEFCEIMQVRDGFFCARLSCCAHRVPIRFLHMRQKISYLGLPFGSNGIFLVGKLHTHEHFIGDACAFMLSTTLSGHKKV